MSLVRKMTWPRSGGRAMVITSLPSLLILASSLVTGLVIFFLKEQSVLLRTVLNLSGAGVKLILVGILMWGVYQGQTFEARLPLLPNIELVLHADALSLLFVSLSTVLWFVTTVYAIGYLEHSPHRSRFFGFFSLCVTATVGIALAGNLITFLIFYELLRPGGLLLVGMRDFELLLEDRPRFWPGRIHDEPEEQIITFDVGNLRRQSEFAGHGLEGVGQPFRVEAAGVADHLDIALQTEPHDIFHLTQKGAGVAQRRILEFLAK